MRSRLAKVVGLGLVYVLVKWALLLLVGAWALENGLGRWLLLYPLVAVPVALSLRGRAASTPSLHKEQLNHG